MPCVEVFEKQSEKYKESVLPNAVRKRVAIEAGSPMCWYKYVGMDGKIIGIDKSAALEMVKAGEVMTEYDKLIDRQLERAVISCTAGFAKIFDGASKVLSV